MGKLPPIPATLRTFLAACAGMFAGYWLAQTFSLSLAPAMAGPATVQDGIVTAKLFKIVDAKGRQRILFGTSQEGSPGIWFFDQNGKSRLNIGIYPDQNAFVVLNDEREQAAEILRTVGAKQSPVLVMKADARDRIVMGLNFNGKGEPFFVHYDEHGNKKTLFGNY
ncbi:MAG: hypothetical protein RIQ81_1144 [Pseudomonadota bacterium]|jgi:hypothetical protein